MKKKKETVDNNKSIDEIVKKQQKNVDDDSKTSEGIDPMGTEVMQEDEYQKNQHGKLPKEDQKKNTEK
ncbi:hypothetical protein QW060_09560 [Myroides ceti]|uniref:Uncharacterized protein n=1 Tax=Paenimyroides ceti TaxID=395087 RepID=A0ABT8CUE5_9FLAO|nr:hypothetical protein [Paenimyroides ceti]MDN3707376.1 hypothetical protein [Paenimyroides ceti]